MLTPPQAVPATGEVPHAVGLGVMQSAVQLLTGVIAVQTEVVEQLGLGVFGGQFTGQKSWFPTESFFTGNTSTYRPNDPVVGTCTFSAGSGGLEGEFAGFGSFLTGIFIARYQ